MAKKTFKQTSLYKDLRRIIKKWEKDQQTDFYSAFRDALTDMRHLAKDNKLDFADMLDSASEAYCEERQRCTECGQRISKNHLSACGKRVTGCDTVFYEDCMDEE